MNQLVEFPLTFPFSFSGMGGARFKRSVIVAMPENKPEPPPRTKQVHCRGRWRVVKRRMKALACELNYPDCSAARPSSYRCRGTAR